MKRHHWLWVLKIIDNIDKHRLILPCLSRVEIATGLPPPKNWFVLDGFNLYKDNVEVKAPATLDLHNNFQPNIRGRIVFDIVTQPFVPEDPPRIWLIDLFKIHHFIRHDVYPRFAKFLKQIDR